MAATICKTIILNPKTNPMLVKIYYNDVRVEKPYLVHTNCPHVKVRLEDAQAFANMKMASGEWFRYLIPELCDSVVVFEEFDPSQTGEVGQ